MDQFKIGKFIAERRKEKNLTQLQLAERLNITDKAISKWERGIAMPDSSIMLELCTILGITVNDLLSGEIITVDNYNKEAENNLIEALRQKEASDKALLKVEIVIGVLSMIILFVPIFIAAFLPMEDWQRFVVMFLGFIPAFIGFFAAMKIEQIAGYYECAVCSHKYVPTFKGISFAMHMGRTRYMKCPKCGNMSWQKKKISKK
ncbi:MAG: helix-turn-helix domain-containing protein [Clostridia bacterium]|nr:helix-turn-helix domain-containing protein [Clostridia bacterium]